MATYIVLASFTDQGIRNALGLAIGAAGNVRTQTMRAFSKEEMNGIVRKME
jgi:uncharacterized protein with GYD domain